MSLTVPPSSPLPGVAPASGAPTRRHISPRWAAAGALAAALVATVGYAGHPLSDSGPVSAAATSRPLGDQVLTDTALPGLVADGPPVVIHRSAGWSSGHPSAVAGEPSERLRMLGFSAAAFARLHTSGPGAVHWTSVVERYRTVAGARQEGRDQMAQLRASRGAVVAGFPVIGAPGARAVSVTRGDAATLEAEFTAGRSVYLVGARFPHSAASAVARGQVSAAAGWLYLALNGCVAPPHPAPPVMTPRGSGRPPLGRI